MEIDVKLTADHVPVLLHDDTLSRLWRRPERIGDLDHAELATLTSVDGGIPTLQDALAIVSGTGTPLLIDLDSPTPAERSVDVVRAAREAGWLEPDEVLWCGRPAASA